MVSPPTIGRHADPRYFKVSLLPIRTVAVTPAAVSLPDRMAAYSAAIKARFWQISCQRFSEASSAGCASWEASRRSVSAIGLSLCATGKLAWVCGLVGYRPTTYHRFMDDPRPADELDGLRQFLNRLETRELAIRRGPLDVSQKQIDILKREIAHLERILAQYKSGGQNA